MELTILLSGRKAQSSAQQGLQISRASWLVLTEDCPDPALDHDNDKFQYAMISYFFHGLQVCVSLYTNGSVITQLWEALLG